MFAGGIMREAARSINKNGKRAPPFFRPHG
jgi:hypothetical protein